MTRRLTLIIEERVISSAKKYAVKHGNTLSHLVEDYLKSIIAKDIEITTLSPRIIKLMGVIKLSTDFNYKATLGNALSEKHKK